MPRGQKTFDLDYFENWLGNRNSHYIDFENVVITQTNLTNNQYEHLIKARDLKRFIRRIERLFAYTDPHIHKKINKRKITKNVNYKILPTKLIIQDRTPNDGYIKTATIIPSENQIILYLHKNGYELIAKAPLRITDKHLEIIKDILRERR